MEEKEKKRRQRGSVIPLGDNTYGIRVPLPERGRSGRNKTHYETIRNVTPLQAEKYKDKLLARIDAGLFFKPKAGKLSTLLDEWLEQKRRQKLKPDSLRTYEAVVEAYVRPHMQHLDVSKLSGRDVRDFYNALQDEELSTGTIKYVRNILRMILKDFRRWGYINLSPADDIAAPEGTEGRDLKAFDLAEAIKFTEACYQDFYIGLVFVFALTTGMRPKEYRGLSWPHVRLVRQELPDGSIIERGLVEVRRIAVKPKGEGWQYLKPKTKKSVRNIPFPAPLYYDLLRYRQETERMKRLVGSRWHEHDLVFPSRNGQPLEDTTLRSRFELLSGRAGLKGFTPYSLRYSYATLQLLGGERDKVIADTMGHSKVSFNQEVYQKVLPEMQDHASDTLERLLFSSVRTTLAQSVSEQVM